MILQEIERKYAEMHANESIFTKLQILSCLLMIFSLALLILVVIMSILQREEDLRQLTIRMSPIMQVIKLPNGECLYVTSVCPVYTNCTLSSATEACVEKTDTSCAFSTQCNTRENQISSMFVAIIIISSVMAMLILLYIVLRCRSREPHTLG